MVKRFKESKYFPEADTNVRITCKDCSTKMYPRKGKFTAEELLEATHVKKAFGREHMWVKITHRDEDHLEGKVENFPIFDASPRFGETVKIQLDEIEDIGPKRKMKNGNT